jgi:hypothetical protein
LSTLSSLVALAVERVAAVVEPVAFAQELDYL